MLEIGRKSSRRNVIAQCYCSCGVKFIFKARIHSFESAYSWFSSIFVKVLFRRKRYKIGKNVMRNNPSLNKFLNSRKLSKVSKVEPLPCDRVYRVFSKTLERIFDIAYVPNSPTSARRALQGCRKFQVHKLLSC